MPNDDLSPTGSVPPGADGTPPAVRRILDGIRLRETSEVGDALAEPDATVTSGSSIFIRGAKHGGSPFLNFLSFVIKAAVVLTIVATLTLISLGWRRVWSLLGGKSVAPVAAVAKDSARTAGAGTSAPTRGGDAAATPGPTVEGFLCLGSDLAKVPRHPGLSAAARAAAGAIRLPSGRALKAIAGARSVVRGPFRVDHFELGAATIEATYGAGATPRALEVRFAEPTPMCAALGMTGALTEAADVRLTVASRGVLVPVGTPPGLFQALFVAAGGVSGPADAPRVAALQFVPRPPAGGARQEGRR